MKIRGEYHVGPELRFLSNLDMMRMMERALRRAEIPYALSAGFNPHIRLSMGTVLPVGLWGENEYFDLELKSNVPSGWLIQQLNTVLPSGIRIKRIKEIDSQEPALMKVINTACYAFVLQGILQADIEKWMEELMQRVDMTVKSRGKKKDVVKDLKTGIYKIGVKGLGDSVIINLTVSTGEPVNIRFDELRDLLLSTDIKAENIIDIYREANYVKIQEEYLTPLEKVV